jgi:phosphoglycerol transferase MdoB-like AlkP superfamily enzyme
MDKLKHFIIWYSALFVVLIIILAALRIFEAVYLYNQLMMILGLKLVLRGMFSDLVFAGLSMCVLIIPIGLINYIFPRVAKIILTVIIVFLAILHAGLMQFFLTNFYLLGHEVFSEKWSNLVTIVSTEFTGERLSFWLIYPLMLLVMITLFFLLFKFIKTSIRLKKVWMVVLVLLFIIVGILGLKSVNSKLPENGQIQNFIPCNKTLYFLRAVHNQWVLNNNLENEFVNVDSYIRSYQKHSGWFQYVSKQYPLLHTNNYPDVLGSYFHFRDTAPNIVIVVCESLSSSYSGFNTHIAQLTPFLDSLMNNGLYWENFISNAERTYNSLPEILASLPYGGERGFTALYNEPYPAPKFYSLVHFLKQNNYSANYFFGGDAKYDNENKFLLNCTIDSIYDQQSYDSTKYDISNGGPKMLYWGYNDKILYKETLRRLDKLPRDKPYLAVITTLSSHTPFNLITHDYYNEAFLRKRLNELGYNFDKVIEKMCYVPQDMIELFELGKKDIKGFITKCLASILFSDDALKEFILAYKKRADYKNTIFVITGDHNISVLPLKNVIDNYRVPLVIYSPLLIKNRRFKAVCSHVDISPSLMAMLQQNFKFFAPKSLPWIGQGLDTCSIFRSRNTSPLTLYGENFAQSIDQEFLITPQKIYSVKETLDLNSCTDKTFCDSLYQLLFIQQVINSYVSKKNKIWP